jgi:hypothetical protein
MENHNLEDVEGDPRRRIYNLRARRVHCTAPSLELETCVGQQDELPHQNPRIHNVCSRTQIEGIDYSPERYLDSHTSPKCAVYRENDVRSGEFQDRVESSGQGVFSARDGGDSEYNGLAGELHSLKSHLKEILERLPIIEARLSQCIERRSKVPATSVPLRSTRTAYATVNRFYQETPEHREHDVPLNILRDRQSLVQPVVRAFGPEPSMHSYGGPHGML